MNYTEYRKQFQTAEEFNRGFGQLPEKEVKVLISAEDCPAFVKACMITAWNRARQEYLKKRSAEICKTDTQEI